MKRHNVEKKVKSLKLSILSNIFSFLGAKVPRTVHIMQNGQFLSNYYYWLGFFGKMFEYEYRITLLAG